MVDGRRLTARRIVIAAGSTAAVPPIPGLDEVPFLTNATLFDLAERPDHLLILGGGPIGLEMADAFAGLGSRVTVVEAATHRRQGGSGTGRRAARRLAGARRRPCWKAPRCARSSRVRRWSWTTAGGSPAAICWSRSAGGRTSRRSISPPATCAPAAPGIATDRGLRSLTNRRVYAVGDIADPRGHRPARLHPCRLLSRRHRDPPRPVPPAGADRLCRAAACHLHRPGAGAGRHDRGRGARRRPPDRRSCAGRSPTTTAPPPSAIPPGLVKLVVAARPRARRRHPGAATPAR